MFDLSLFVALKGGEDHVKLKFKKELPTTSGYIARPFLCGATLTNTANVIAISIIGKEVSTSGLKVGIISASKPTALSVSYIVFSPSTAGFASYGGIIDQPMIPSAVSLSVHKSLCTFDNFIYGLNSFSAGNSPSMNIHSGINRDFVLTVNPGQITTKLTFSYIIYGLSPKYVCANCADKLNRFGGNCVNECNPGEARFTYPDGSEGCVVCSDSANLVVSEDGTSCVCRPGTTNLHGICSSVQPYQTNEYYGGEGESRTSISSSSSSQSSSSSLGSYADYLAKLAGQQSSSNAGSTTASSNAGSSPLKPIFGNGGVVVSTTTTTTTKNNGGNFILSQPSGNQPLTVPPISSDPNAGQTTLPLVGSNAQTITVTTNGVPPSCKIIPNSYWNGAACVCLPTFTNSSGACVPSGQQGWVKVSTTTSGKGSQALPATVSPISSPTASGPSSCASIPNSYWNGASCACFPGYNNATGQCQKADAPQQQPATVPPISGGSQALPPTANPINGGVTYPNGGIVYPGNVGVNGGPVSGTVISGTTYPGGPTFIAGNTNPNAGIAFVPGNPAAPVDPSQVVILPPGYPNGGVYPGGYPNGPNGYPNGPYPNGPYPNGPYPNGPNYGPIVCPYDRYPLAGICVCKPNYYQTPYGECERQHDHRDRNRTDPDPDCGPNGQYNWQKEDCVCRTGFYWTGNGCAPGRECPNNSTRINATNCTCNSPLVLVNGICARCYENGFWDGTKCIYLCGTFSTYDAAKRACVCNNGYGVSPGNTACLPCPPNSRTINNTCAVCPSNSHLIGQTCVCNDGFRPNPQGFCLNTCPAGSTFVATSGRCRCLQLNFFMSNNRCIACPANSYSDGFVCTACPVGTTVSNNTCACPNPSQIFDKFVGRCVTCPLNSFPRNGVCVSCPINSTYDADADRCVCNTGYARVGALCINICPDGIYIGGNVCAFCPLNSIPSNNQCICRLGYSRYANGAACLKSCPGGTFLLPNGSCVACPLFQGYNTRTQRCQCLAGYVLNADGLCVRNCPYGATLSATGNCDCNLRYYPANGVCLSCPNTCLSCTNSTTCLTCIPGYNLVAGRCVPNDPLRPACLTNQFLNAASVCTNCLPMCLTCTSATTCSRCATGFLWNAATTTCFETCGDGVRLFQQCDDNNTIAGDGCSPTCTIEPGWICQKNPVNPTLPDYCVNPNKNKDPSGNKGYDLSVISSLNAVGGVSLKVDIKKNNGKGPVTYYYDKYNPSTARSESAKLVSFSAPGIVVSGSCTQEKQNEIRWNCRLNWQNQPSKKNFRITLTAQDPDNVIGSTSYDVNVMVGATSALAH